MILSQNIKNLILDKREKRIIHHRRVAEIDKINDPIPLFPKVLEAAFQMHETLPELGCVNWDFTLDENGTPILIEANISDGSIWLSQMSNGVGAFGQDTPEILEWIHKMEGVKLSDRYKYRFGR